MRLRSCEGNILFVPQVAMPGSMSRPGRKIIWWWYRRRAAPGARGRKHQVERTGKFCRGGAASAITPQTQAPEAPLTPSDQILGGLSGTVYADSGGLSLSGEDDGWAYTVKASPLPDKLNLDLDVSRKYNGLVVKVTGSGYVQNFETAATS